MDETKRITTAFQDKAAGAGSIEAIQCDLDNIEKAFTDCNEELAAMEMPDCGYCFQGEAILEMAENLRALFIYVGCAHPHVSEVLDFPLYTDFKSNATESLSHIVLDDIRTDNTFGMEEHVEVNDAGYLRVDSRVKEDLGFSDFFGITDIRPQDGYPVLENVETVGEFASLFRADYDRMKPEGMDINTFLEGYLTYGEYEHTGYHPVRDFLSGLADVTIIIPVIDAILGKDIITGETLNDFERGMKAAGAVIDLFTLGQAMVLAGGVEAGAGIIVKTLAVEMVSNAAGYSAGYAANEMGMPLPVTWILSVATGCTVSATVGGYLFTSADGTITKCTAEEAGDLIKRLDKTDSPTSFADMMSPEDATRYLRFLENGSTEGLTSAELEGIKKVDELLALKKISYQDVLDIRNSGKALESGSASGKVWDYSKQFDGELANFNAGYEIKNVIDEDLYLVQFHSNAEVGSGRSLKYWTTFDEANGISTVDDYMNKMALLSNWGARDNVSIAKIPAGTKIKYAIGTAKEQVGAIESRPGGGLQILFEQFDDSWVLDTRPLL